MRLSRFGAIGAAVPAAWLAVWLAAGPATAGNWTLGGSVVERLSARSDLGFNEGDEATFSSSTGLRMALGYLTPTTSWRLSSGASYRQPIGSGEEGQLDGVTNPRISSSVAHRGLRHSVGARFSLARRVLNFTDAPLFLDDFVEGPGEAPGEEPIPDPAEDGIDLIEIAEEDATETRLGFGANWSYAVSPLTSLSLGTNMNVRRFSDESPSLVPSRSIGFSGSVSRALDPRTSTGLSLSYRNFRSDGELTDTRTDAVTLLVNASRRLTLRHSLGLSLGGGATRTEETDALGAVVDDDEGVSPNFQGGVTFSYTGLRGTSFVLSASRSLEVTSDGRLVNATRLSGAANYALPLTRRTSFRMGGVMSLSADSDDEGSGLGQGIRVRTGLNTRLSPAWSASAGFDLGYARNEDEDDVSAGVFLQVGRSFDLIR